MNYKVRVSGNGAHPLKRDYGTGAEGLGEAYRTKTGAEKRAKELRKRFSSKKGFTVAVVRVRESGFAH